MTKQKTTVFFCSECGFESAKWMGQCPACHAWNTMVEGPAAPVIPGKISAGRGAVIAKPAYLKDVVIDDRDRYDSGMEEFNRVLGGGIVAGSLVLVGGDPGIGKSTILLQICRNLANSGRKVLYISGEESLKQIKLRADRIGEITGDLKFLCETDLDAIASLLISDKPDVAVVDSVQTMSVSEVSSAPGSVSQIRETTNTLLQVAKSNAIAIMLVGHVTKEGQVAGPRMLEHMVDTVLYFEGDRSESYRILRAVKNRFGSTNEIGVFEMRREGLAEVPNPSEYMLEGRPKGSSGAVVACSMEGTRPIMVEVQALVNKTAFGMPRRTAAGADYNRVNLLMAVLEKRCHLPMSGYDAYVNIAGGIKMTEPAIDLAIIIAIVSSYNDVPVDEHTVFFGEVGLSGEVRAVSMAENRVKEAAKLGFKTAVVPKSVLSRIGKIEGIDVVGVTTIGEVIDYGKA
ncbi:MAG: DNA repair protein RadA [Lachnospiraceae bacterium]|nr:DNA repair protein RadA [Lachnospiraceae bacterium]